MLHLTDERIETAYQSALKELLAARHADGYWVGQLSTSALSTATAVMALHLVQAFQKELPQLSQTSEVGHGPFDDLIAGGLRWLNSHQNEDGGWGDTVKSVSNISTTMLCRAAIYLTGSTEKYSAVLRRCEDWLAERYGKTPHELADAVRGRYGKDRTFAVPILTTCALAGLVDWDEVPPLPFELACFPQSWFRFLRLHVVSYALPALIAIGQCIYEYNTPKNSFIRFIRGLARNRSLDVLERIQPTNGGFLEATPLTSFVTLSLAAIGLGDHPVARLGVDFIVNSVHDDGSWPIDTNLSTWVTTLSINALAAAGELENLDGKEELVQWLLNQQYTKRHPYTGAAPGGWAWTPLPGGVPDADDTPGALLAIANLRRAIDVESVKHESDDSSAGEYRFQEVPAMGQAAALLSPSSKTVKKLPPVVLPDVCYGCKWLIQLQNRDGGWPTFCRGWGRLPFDRSGCDLTAHVLRVFAVWRGWLEYAWQQVKNDELGSQWLDSIAVNTDKLKRKIDRAYRYLERQQRDDGSWLPLWFGNQHAPDDINPTYGTARVLAAYRDLDMMNTEPAQYGIAWLVDNQNDDGGWGGCKDAPSSVEETALAVEILLDARFQDAHVAVNKGLHWLVEQVEAGGLENPTPIGFYFAKLWYFEKLYPIIFTVAALGKARRESQEIPPAPEARQNTKQATTAFERKDSQ